MKDLNARFKDALPPPIRNFPLTTLFSELCKFISGIYETSRDSTVRRQRSRISWRCVIQHSGNEEHRLTFLPFFLSCKASLQIRRDNGVSMIRRCFSKSKAMGNRALSLRRVRITLVIRDADCSVALARRRQIGVKRTVSFRRNIETHRLSRSDRAERRVDAGIMRRRDEKIRRSSI